MKIYLDDLRTAPEGWIRAYRVDEVKYLLLNNEVTHVSLDHDLGASYFCDACDEKQGESGDCFGEPGTVGYCECKCHDLITPTGYDLVKWMAENDIWPMYKPIVHSANPVGAKRMREDIDRYWHPPRDK